MAVQALEWPARKGVHCHVTVEFGESKCPGTQASEESPAKFKSSTTKTATLLGLLSKPGGATVENMARAAGWQIHSVRGFLAGHVRTKLGLNLFSEKDAEGVRLYRLLER